MSAWPNSSRRVIAGKTAQKPSQYRHALQICSWRAASPSSTPRLASRLSASSDCTVLFLTRDCRRAAAGDAPERGADRHADAGRVALAEDVSGHHLAGREEVVARHAGEMDRG